MMTLAQEIEAIESSKASYASKRRSLLELGLMPNEVRLVLPPAMRIAATRLPITFGVEIECNVSRHSLRNEAAATGLSYQYEGYNHNDGHAHFKFVSDGSVRGENPIECVSPILKGRNGLKALKTACDTLNNAGATVNRSCGLHVHIGLPNMSQDHFARVFKNYYYVENLIDSFMAPSRRSDVNMYCDSIRNHSNLLNANTVGEVQSALHRCRYHKINPMSFSRHNTIEFRQHQGTTNYKKISKWIAFCSKLVEWSKENTFNREISSIDEIPFLNVAEKNYFKTRINEVNTSRVAC